MILRRTGNFAFMIAVSASLTASPADRAAETVVEVLKAQIQEGLSRAPVADGEALARVAAESVDAIVRGDMRAFHKVAASRGAVLSVSRMREVREGLADRPRDRVPPDLNTMTDAAVVDEVTKRVKPLQSAALEGLTVRDVGDVSAASPIASFFVREPGKSSRRLNFPANGAVFAPLLHVSPGTERMGAVGKLPGVVVEFEGRAGSGPVLIGVAFALTPDSGWLPSAIMVVGGPIALPR